MSKIRLERPADRLLGAVPPLESASAPAKPATHRSPIGIVTRSNAYHVSASDAAGVEIWRFRPASEDLATCQRFLNAYYAFTKRPVPTADATSGPASKPN